MVPEPIDISRETVQINSMLEAIRYQILLSIQYHFFLQFSEELSFLRPLAFFPDLAPNMPHEKKTFFLFFHRGPLWSQNILFHMSKGQFF